MRIKNTLYNLLLAVDFNMKEKRLRINPLDIEWPGSTKIRTHDHPHAL